MLVFDELHAFLWNDPTANNANTYLIHGSKKILIDPGHLHLFRVVREELQKVPISLSEIDLVIITHAHPDHMEAVRAFADMSALIAFPALEYDFVNTLASQYGADLGMKGAEPHLFLTEGNLDVGEVGLTVYHTPGHSPGSISLYWPEKGALFTGDVVFTQGIGRTDLPGGDGEKLKDSIRRLSRLNARYLLPGHGPLLSDPRSVQTNFEEVERMWFAYL